ncbi:MAG: glycosyltransferase [Acidobacteriota bacterium]|nr:glycosyltransferase [Acidobacteriota bacterium]
MRILMLAPEPFFEPRGTPFSEYHRIKALGELGHRIDLVTYPFGLDVDLPNLRIFRSMRPPFVRKVRIGPSFTKLALDGLMLLTVARRAMAERYDAIHSHEEMGLVGVWLARWLRIPHLYDMHSSLPQQLSNFKYSKSGLLRKIFVWAEGQMVRKSQVVITICQELQHTVIDMGVGERSLLIENVMGGDVDDPPTRSPQEVRAAWGVAPDAPLALYTGTFEAYQGVEMLIEAAAIVARRRPDARVLVVGGEAPQVEAAKSKAQAAGVSAAMIFTGQQPAREIPGFVQAADLLVSPRIRGTNTPLKIYSYLRSGKPIVATDLLTHTQVLTPAIAKLVPPLPGPFAQAVLDLIEHPEDGARLAAAARAVADDKYGRESYVRRTAQAYARLMDPGARPALSERASGNAGGKRVEG